MKRAHVRLAAVGALASIVVLACAPSKSVGVADEHAREVEARANESHNAPSADSAPRASVADAARQRSRSENALVASLDATQIQRILRHGPLGPPEPDPTNRWESSDEAARFGQRLFFDTRLSTNGFFSCATCHMPGRAFADGLDLPVPEGSSDRHVPTILNSAYHRWQFWDGRSDSLWNQAIQPIDNPKELGVGRAGLAKLVTEDALLAREYRAIFGEEPSFDPAHVDRTAVFAAKAIAAYETRLVSADSAFDRFADALARDDLDAAADYPEDALRGLLLFTGRANCRSCHAGPMFTDGEFHSIGMPPRGGGALRDPGRMRGIELLRADPFRGTGPHSDAPDSERAREIETLVQSAEQWGQLRTPSLRNVARTAPYMSQGQVATLREILRYYSTLEGAVAAGHHGEQVLEPLHLSEGEMDDLEAFLKTLDGVDPPATWAKPLPKGR